MSVSEFGDVPSVCCPDPRFVVEWITDDALHHTFHLVIASHLALRTHLQHLATHNQCPNERTRQYPPCPGSKQCLSSMPVSHLCLRISIRRETRVNFTHLTLCRKRKLKCDAVRPTCGNCARPRVRGAKAGETPPPCEWDSARGGGGSEERDAGGEAAVGVGAGGASGSGGKASLGQGNTAGGASGQDRKRARLDDLEERLGEWDCEGYFNVTNS